MHVNTYSPPASAESEHAARVGVTSSLRDAFTEESSPDSYAQTSNKNISKNTLLGQFSFAPATQTTVVTTTTTTTTNFPPLLLRAPKGIHDPDPRLYPLAASPTPQHIKELQFQFGGRPVIYREADEAADMLTRVS